MEFLLYIGAALICAFLFVAIVCPTRGARKDSKPAGNKYDSVFRIVELQNGMYRVEQLSYWTEWSIPSGIGPYNFDTLEEAQARKEQLIAELAKCDGYRVKRVVD